MDIARNYHYRGRRIVFREHAVSRCVQRGLSAEYVAQALAFAADGQHAPGIYRQTIINFIVVYERFPDKLEIITLYRITTGDSRVGTVEVERRRRIAKGGGRRVRCRRARTTAHAP